MAYQLKYFTQFVSIDDKLNRVELWQDTRPETGGGEDLIIQDPALFEIGSIDNFTGANKTDATSIRSINFVNLTEDGVMTLYSKTNTPFSVQFYDVNGAFLGGVQHSDGFDPIFITGTMNHLGVLKFNETLINL